MHTWIKLSTNANIHYLLYTSPKYISGIAGLERQCKAYPVENWIGLEQIYVLIFTLMPVDQVQGREILHLHFMHWKNISKRLLLSLAVLGYNKIHKIHLSYVKKYSHQCFSSGCKIQWHIPRQLIMVLSFYTDSTETVWQTLS